MLSNRDYAPAQFNTQDNRRIIVFSITERGNAPAVVQLSRQQAEQCCRITFITTDVALITCIIDRDHAPAVVIV